MEGLKTASLGDEKCVKSRKTDAECRACAVDLSDVPLNLPFISPDRPGSALRFNGVYKQEKKSQAKIRIPFEGGQVSLGTFESEEEAGIVYVRARYKYPRTD